jgi:ABC-type Fe3+ transport system permease subunit
LKWATIRYRRPSAIAAAVPTVLAFIVATAFIVTVGVFLTGTGCAWAMLRRRSRLKRSLTNLELAESYGNLDFRSAKVKAGNQR